MATNNNRNAYGILGISSDSSVEDVKRRYHELAKRYHPDKQKNKSGDEAENAAEMYEQIKWAYETLTDAELRLSLIHI